MHGLGLANLAPAQKKEFQLKIAQMRFNPDRAEDRGEIIKYCFSDCDGCGALYARVGGRVEPPLMAHWVEYLKAVARMELRAIPFDVEGFEAIRANYPSIRATLIGDVNRTWPVFEGESFRKKSFLRWCRAIGIDWPVGTSPATGKPYFQFDNETFKAMEGRHPFIAEVRQVKKTLARFGQRSLTVDPDRPPALLQYQAVSVCHRPEPARELRLQRAEVVTPVDHRRVARTRPGLRRLHRAGDRHRRGVVRRRRDAGHLRGVGLPHGVRRACRGRAAGGDSGQPPGGA